MPYSAGVGGMGPPNSGTAPEWVDVYDRTSGSLVALSNSLLSGGSRPNSRGPSFVLSPRPVSRRSQHPVSDPGESSGW